MAIQRSMEEDEDEDEDEDEETGQKGVGREGGGGARGS